VAVVRIQSLKLNSLLSASKHRLSPPSDRELLIACDADFDLKVPDEIADTLTDILEYSNGVKKVVDFFKFIESAGYTRKIRKNATIQELVVAYSEDEIKTHYDIYRDIRSFKKSFAEKYGFEPFIFYFIHKHKHSNMYHIHIFFSLRKPDLSTKVRWRKREYFEIKTAMQKRNSRITTPKRGKNIGAYPLWFIRKLQKEYGTEVAKEVTKLARQRGYPIRKFIEHAEELAKTIRNNQQPEEHPQRTPFTKSS